MEKQDYRDDEGFCTIEMGSIYNNCGHYKHNNRLKMCEYDKGKCTRPEQEK